MPLRRPASMRAERPALRRLAAILIGAAAVPVLAPYAIAPLYRFIDPISTPMLWRYATGARVERIAVPLDRIAPALQLAAIVAEYGSFCRNHGIDLGAMREALQQRGEYGETRGASTITQQTVKNLFLWQAAVMSARRSKSRWRCGSTSCCRSGASWRFISTSPNGDRTANSAPRPAPATPSANRRSS